MFTGIIESKGVVEQVKESGTGKIFTVSSLLSASLKADQSISHNGVCLTVELVHQHSHQVTAISETLSKTNLGAWLPGHEINLERCLPVNGRLDGHLVQGHVDTTGVCTDIQSFAGSHEYRFRYPEQFAHLVIEKGSICVEGISLTAFNITGNEFSIAIIPYTYEHTNISALQTGKLVNLEFDIIGKYISRMISLKQYQ